MCEFEVIRSNTKKLRSVTLDATLFLILRDEGKGFSHAVFRKEYIFSSSPKNDLNYHQKIRHSLNFLFMVDIVHKNSTAHPCAGFFVLRDTIDVNDVFTGNFIH